MLSGWLYAGSSFLWTKTSRAGESWRTRESCASFGYRTTNTILFEKWIGYCAGGMVMSIALFLVSAHSTRFGLNHLRIDIRPAERHLSGVVQHTRIKKGWV